MQRKKTLRSSFVVTVAATSALLGAGCSDSAGSSPADAPVAGDASDVLTTGDVSDVPVVSDASDATALPDTNPPPMCPAAAPSNGAPCTPGMAVQMCSYGDCLGRPTTTARCATGTWEVVNSTCNPPPDVPTDGPTDAVADAPDAPTDGPTDAVADAPDASPCPDAEPTMGATCASPGASCMYGGCTPMGGRMTHATCDDTGHWSVGTIICNPPRITDAGNDA